MYAVKHQVFCAFSERHQNIIVQHSVVCPFPVLYVGRSVVGEINLIYEYVIGQQ